MADLLIELCVGLPGSGKTTYVDRIFKDQRQQTDVTLVRLSPDSKLYEGDDYVWSRDRSSKAWATEQTELGHIARLSFTTMRRFHVIFDATFLTVISRSFIVNAFGKGMRAVTRATYFDTPFEVCLARNNLRATDRIVPEESMKKMAMMLEAPTMLEGFDQVTVVAYKP